MTRLLNHWKKTLARAVSPRCPAPFRKRGRKLMLELLESRVVPSTVWIDSVANAEEGVSTGYFRVMRDQTSGTLTVNYTIDSGSTAYEGIDYDYLLGSVTFGDGDSYADIVVDPTGAYDDSEVEGDETVEIQLESGGGCCCGGGGYTLGSPSSASLTIADNEEEATVWIDSTSDAEEGVSTGYFRVMRDQTSGALTVNYTVDVSSTAYEGIDYDYLMGSVTFGDGDSYADIVVDPTGIYDDSDVEGNETVAIQLELAGGGGGGGGGYTLGSPSSASLTIADNDEEAIVWIDSTADAEEGVSTGYFRVMRDQTSGALTVNYMIDSSSTADEGIDYDYLTGSVTIGDGDSYADIVVDPTGAYDDSNYEGDETVAIQLQAGGGCGGGASYALGSPSAGTLTIAENDVQPTVNIYATDPTADEAGSDVGVFTLTRDGDNTNPLTVNLTISGSASNGIDYNNIATTATIPAGSSITTIVVTPIYDGIVENEEQVNVALANAPAYLIGAAASAVVAIQDNSPTVSIAATDASASEPGADRGVFTVTRTGPTTNALTVNYTVGPAAGGATNGVDYNQLNGSVSIPAGSSSATIVVIPQDDNTAEPNEDVTLTLAAAMTYQIGAANSATVTIADDEPTVTIQATVADAFEGGAPGRFTLTRTGSSAAALTVNFTIGGTATNGTDYANINANVTIPAGDSTAVIDVAATQDNTVDADEVVTLTLSNNAAYHVGTPNAATVNIVDVSPTVRIVAIDPGAQENPAENGQFRVYRTGSTANALNVNYAITGSATNANDYQQLTGTVNIAAGQSSATINVVPNNDATAEGEETVILTISNNAAYTIGTQNQDTVTIYDDEPIVRLRATTATAREQGPVNGVFTIERVGSNANALDVSYAVSGTATNGTDHNMLNGTATIMAGQDSVTITVTPVDDATGEPTETVILTLTNSTDYVIWSAEGSATVSIEDNDNQPTVTVQATTANASEAGPTNGVYTFTRVGGDQTQALTVNYTVAGTATNTADYANLNGTVTIQATQASVTLNVVPVNDAAAEPTETVILTISNSANYAVGTDASATVTIADNEDTIYITTVTDTTEEDGSAADGRFRVHRTGDTTANLVVGLTIAGSATNGMDYTNIPATVTIMAGQATADIDVSPIDDGNREPTETVQITVNNSGGFTAVGPTSAVVTITDNEPTVWVLPYIPGAGPGGGPLPLRSNASEPSRTAVFLVGAMNITGPLAVDFGMTGTADRGATDDYTLREFGGAAIPANTINLTVADPAVLVEVVPVDDSIAEPTETVIFTIAASASYYIDNSSTTTVMLSDDDTPADDTPRISVVASDSTATEGGNDPGVFTVSRTGDTSNAVTVNYAVTGTASNGVDYTALNGAVQIPANQASATIPVTPSDDSIAEGDESVTVTLVGGSDYVVEPANDDATVTIADDEPEVTVAASDANASEAGSDPGVFTVTRTGSTANALTVQYSISGTATNGVDYSQLSGTVQIAANASSATITISPQSDAVVDANETVTVTLTADTNYTVGAAGNATVTIADSSPTVSVNATTATTTEGSATPGVFTVTRTGSTDGQLVVNYALSGAATNNVDYSNLTGSVTIANGASSATINVAAINDAIAEPTEDVILTLTSSSAYTIGANNTATVNIQDNRSTVTVTATDNTAAEQAQATGTFRIARTAPTTAALTVTYSLTGGAVTGIDYQALTGTVQIPANQPHIDITITPVDDPIDENDETVVLTVLGSSAYTVGASNSATITIADNDGPPAGAGSTVSVAATTPSAAEEGPVNGVFTISRTNPTTNALTVYYSLSGSATNSLDFTALAGSVEIPANQASVTVTVTPVDDNLGEGDETVTLTINGTADYVVSGTSPNATVTISDNEPTVTITATQPNASESGPTNGTFVVTRTGATTNNLVVNYAISGTATNNLDYSNLTGSVTINAGQNSANITVIPVADNLVENTETVILTLTPMSPYQVGGGGDNTATVNITDDAPSVTIAATDPTASEENQDTGTFVVTRSVVTADPLTVNYSIGGSATNNTDYTLLNGSVTIPANQGTANITITPVDDGVAEGSETVELTLTSGSDYSAGNPSSATVTIADNEQTVTVNATDAVGTEVAGDTGEFTFSRTGPTTNALTVYYTISGTATNGVDYTSIPGSVTIAATQASATVTITPTNDTVYDPSETVIVTISSAPSYTVGAPANATVQIADNEVRLKSVAFSGAGNFTIEHDVTGSPYNGDHWLDNNGDGDVADAGDHSYPVGYASGSTMSLEVTFIKDPLMTFVNPQIQGTTAGFAIAPRAPDSITANELSINATAVNNAFAANTIRAYDPMVFTWQVSHDGNWMPAGTSSNPVYVTRNAPVGGTVLRHTVVRLGTKNAEGAANVDDTINAVWSEFTDRQVIRVDQPLSLSYYGDYHTMNVTTASLIANGVGQCGSVNSLFLDMLKLHGIQQANWYLTVESSTAGESFLVNDWTFNGNGYDPNDPYPYLNIVSSTGARTNTGYNFIYAQVTDANGIPGVGNGNPAANFGNHQIARITVGGVVRYFDASYGVTYGSLAEMSTVAIAGFYVQQTNVNIDETIVGMDLNGDGDQTDTAVLVSAVWRIRKKSPFDVNDLQIASQFTY